MKFRAMITYCLAVAVGLAVAYEHGRAETPTKNAARIGVVSIRRIFNQCQRNAKYRQEAVGEQEKVMAEM
jgi:hypothetical protein